jgi:bifunctional DNase/RNase
MAPEHDFTPVECELARLIINESGQAPQMVMLREKDGERALPIMIGIVEAVAIDRRLRDEDMVRPMTHDLFCASLAALEVSVERVTVCDLRNGTFYGLLTLAAPDGRTVEIDARPSDCLAIAVREECPVYVADHVLEEVARENQ